MYKPEAKRRWGYFALPILHGDRLVGKLDAKADHKASVLRVNAIHEDVKFTRASQRACRPSSRTWPRGSSWTRSSTESYLSALCSFCRVQTISRRDLKPLADELSQCWHELGAVLRSRRLLASLHPGLAAKLTPSKLRALDLLAEHGGMRVGELADRVGIDDATATRLVDRLEEMGVVSRKSDVVDRRATTVALTPAGEERRRRHRQAAATLLL